MGGGDYAYDLHTNNGELGLEFLKEAEVLFSSLPFLPVAGNHESNYPDRDFKYFNSYFRTPHYQATKNDMFTASFGRVLLIGYNMNYFE